MKLLVIVGVIVYWSNSLSAQILYRCTSPANDTVTYLLGTHHYLSKERFSYDPMLDTIMNRANIIFAESYANVGQPDYSQTLVKLLKGTTFPNDSSLSDYLSAEQLDSVRTYYREHYNISSRQFDRVDHYLPCFMNLRLIFPINTYERIDTRLVQQAKKFQRKIINLDTPEMLVPTYQVLGDHYNIDWLMGVIRNYPLHRTNDSLLADAYNRQDTTTIKRLIVENGEATLDPVILWRNQAWEKIILREAGSVNFIFAGMAHLLVEKGGLLAFFRKRGYSIEAVPLSLVK